MGKVLELWPIKRCCHESYITMPGILVDFCVIVNS